MSTDYPAASAAALTRAFHRSKQRAPLFIQYGPKYPEFLALAGDAADGVVFNVLGGPIEALDLTQELRHRFYATYGDTPTGTVWTRSESRSTFRSDRAPSG